MKFLFFSIFAFLYSLLIKFILFLYNKKFLLSKSPANSFIVSVGNLSVGGTGKTPMISWLIRELKKEFLSCGVISRGYGRSGYKKIVVLSKKTSPAVAGDEPYMLYKEHSNVPVVVGNKIKACFLMKNQFNPDVILVDDGFQSFGLKRNIDIVLIDLSRPLSDYFVMPAGLLREPLQGLSRASAIIFTKSNFMREEKKIKKHLLRFINKKNTLLLDSSFESRLLLFNRPFGVFDSYKEIKEKTVCFSGIANSDPFIKTAGLFCKNIVKIFSFGDHCKYKKKEVQQIRSSMASYQAKAIITTTKDFWKIKDFFSDYKLYVVDVRHVIKNRKQLIDLISLRKN